MTTGTMSALEGDGDTLGGIIQSNWFFYFTQQPEGVDVFQSPIVFAMPAMGEMAASESGEDGFLAVAVHTEKPSVVTGGRRNNDLVWGEWPVLDDEEARKIKRKRNELLLLVH